MRSFRYACLFVLPLLLLVPDRASAQDADADTTGWVTDLAGKLAASQAGYRNWQEGGVNTFAFTVGTSGKAERTDDRWQQTYDGRLAFGLVKQDTLDVRKADDVIRLGAALQYQGDGFFRVFNPTVAATARTQFAAGFNYESNPFEDDERTPPVQVSAFMSPGVFTQSVGLTYEPTSWFTQRVGVAAKETAVLDEDFRVLYGLSPDQSVRFEMGLESKTEVDREIMENVQFTSTLSLFAAFNQAEQPDILWENLIVMQVNRFLSVNFEFVTLYDRDISNEVQLKEVLSLGVTVTLL